MDPASSPTVLRALAHPVRVRLLNATLDAPATSAQLARRTGQTRGNISYHLRFLARAGLVEEVLDQGTDRERWWRARSLPELDAGDLVGPSGRRSTCGRSRAETALQADLMSAADAVIGERGRRLTAFAERLRAGQVPPERSAAARVGELRLRISAEDQAELVAELDAVLAGWERRAPAPAADGEVVEVQVAVFSAVHDG